MDARETVRTKIAEVLGRPAGQLSDDAVLTDLVSSSFLLVETMIELQETFDVRFQQEDIVDVVNVGQLLDLVSSRIDVPAEA